MLAAWGFLLTGICFGLFASTFKTMVVDKTGLKLNSFSYAYYCLALAMATWSIAAANGGSMLLKNSVLVGDGLILAGSVFMVSSLAGQRRKIWILISALGAAALLAARAKYYTPAPYMSSGVLVFNSQTPAAIALGVIFIAIWLPANLNAARQIARPIKHQDLNVYYTSIYTAATASALLFLASRRALAVVLSFAAIGICFAMLLASNMLISKLESRHAAK